MKNALVILPTEKALALPALIARADEKTVERFIEFFTANISNDNTRHAYARAVGQFLNWCEGHGATLHDIRPVMVAAYIKQHPGVVPTVKQHLAAINMLFNWFVTGQVLPTNPAASVRAPRYSQKKGKTPVLSGKEARRLLDSIDTSHVVGLRDRALIALMIYSFARVSAAVNMNVRDYYANGKRYWIRLHEKGGKFHEVPVHHTAEQYLDEYLQATGINEKNAPLFRTARGRTRTLTKNRMSRQDVFYMIRRRAEDAGITAPIGCHTWRATGITAYLENGGTIEHAQTIAAHESPRTTKLYDRTGDQISLDEIERIRI